VIIISHFVRKYGFVFKRYFNYKDKHFRRMVFLAIPGVFGISINHINALVDKTIASQVQEGGVSDLSYANKITLLIDGEFVISIVTVLYSTMARKAANKDYTGLKSELKNTFNIMMVCIIPITVYFMVKSNEIIDIVYGRGEFDKDAVLVTANTFYFYSIGMISFALRDVLIRAFYSV